MAQAARLSWAPRPSVLWSWIVLPTEGAHHLVSQELAKVVRESVAIGPRSLNSPQGGLVFHFQCSSYFGRNLS